jgi:hypothetical protein
MRDISVSSESRKYVPFGLSLARFENRQIKKGSRMRDPFL